MAGHDKTWHGRRLVRKWAGLGDRGVVVAWWWLRQKNWWAWRHGLDRHGQAEKAVTGSWHERRKEADRRQAWPTTLQAAWWASSLLPNISYMCLHAYLLFSTLPAHTFYARLPARGLPALLTLWASTISPALDATTFSTLHTCLLAFELNSTHYCCTHTVSYFAFCCFLAYLPHCNTFACCTVCTACL